jgi:hypothetical protein
VTSATSWSKYLMAVTPSTMSSHTPLGIFGKTKVPYTCGWAPPCMFLSALPFCLTFGDEAPTSGTPLCTASCPYSSSWLYGAKIMAFSVCHGPCPLEVLDSFLSVSSSIHLTSCIRFFSSSTITGFVSYSGVWISSTSTTTSAPCSHASVMWEVLRMFLSALPDSPT